MSHNQKIDSNSLCKEYELKKTEFLDSLEPDDFRNGESFNNAGIIIDQINESLYKKFLSKKDLEGFIETAVSNIFRKDSPAINKAIELADLYLEEKSK